MLHTFMISSSSNFLSRRILQNTFLMYNISTIISQMYSPGWEAHRANNCYSTIMQLGWSRVLGGIFLLFPAWWRHQMETFSAQLAVCAGNSPVPDEFPTQRPVTRSFNVFFYLRLNNGWVNNGESGDLRRHRGHYDVTVMCTSDGRAHCILKMCGSISVSLLFIYNLMIQHEAHKYDIMTVAKHAYRML